MRSRARLGAGIVAAALSVGMVAWSATSAGASGPSASGSTAVASAKPAKQAVVIRTGKGDADPVVAAAARRFGLSPKKIEQGLVAVKVYLGQYGGKTRSGEPDFLSPGAVRVFAHAVGISPARAKQVLTFILKLADSQPGKSGKQNADAIVAAAAKRFGLPAKKIEAGLVAVKKYIASQGGSKSGEPDLLSPGAVRAFAHAVGISPARAKQVLTFILKLAKSQQGKPGPGKPGEPGKPGDPGKPAPGKP